MWRRKLRLDVEVKTINTQSHLCPALIVETGSAVPRSPNSPLPVRHSAACCLTQFSSARGCRARGERRGEGGRQGSAQFQPQVCNANEAPRDSNQTLQYWLFLLLGSLYAQTSPFYVPQSTYTRSLLSYHQQYLTTIKIRMWKFIHHDEVIFNEFRSAKILIIMSSRK